MTLCIHTGTNTQTNQPVSSPQIKIEIGGEIMIFLVSSLCACYLLLNGTKCDVYYCTIYNIHNDIVNNQ